MSEIWNQVYSFDNRFFGNEPSNFAKLCFNIMKQNNVKNLLELGTGHGRDSIFFASNGIKVTAFDYSKTGIDILINLAKEKNLAINTQVFDIKSPLPFSNSTFDVVYSHMLFNMRFSQEELGFAFSEIRRVLKPGGFNFFSVRNHNDKFYGKGIKVDDEIFDINGFVIRFYTEKEILDLIKNDFEILWIKEEYEEPVMLYLVASRLATT